MTDVHPVPPATHDAGQADAGTTAAYRVAHAARSEALEAVESRPDPLDTLVQAIERAQAEARARRHPSRAVKAAAAHEAGHAVVALAAGADVLGAVVYSDGSGATWMAAGTSTDDAALAGAVAESWSGVPGANTARPSASDLALLKGDVRANIVSGWRAEAILAENWERVSMLADRLASRGYVSGELARAIVGRVRVPTVDVDPSPRGLQGGARGDRG